MADSRFPAAFLALALIAGQAGGTGAEAADYIGSAGGSVEVNFDVLDSLGSPPTVAGLLRSDIRRNYRAGTPLPLPGEARRPAARSSLQGAPLPPPGRRTAALPGSAGIQPPVARPSTTRPPIARPAAPPATRQTVTRPAVTRPAVPSPAAPQPPATQNKAPAAPTARITAPPPAIPPVPQVARSEAPKAAATKAPEVRIPAPPVTAPPATAAPAAARPAPEPAPAPQQVAAANPAPPPAPAPAPSSGGAALRVVFAADETSLPEGGHPALAEVISRLKADPALRIQLLAYASTADRSEARARRFSLSRALGIRSFLIAEGITSVRMDVRALGDKAPDAPRDRVDLLLTER